MRPRKSQTRPDNATEVRLNEVCAALGFKKDLPLAWLADAAGINRSTLKNAASRDSLSDDVARPIARLMAGDEQRLVRWLRGETAEHPAPAEMAPRASLAVPVPSGDSHTPRLLSGPLRVDEVERVRVLADRIARTIRDTIVGNEMGYTPATRRLLANSLEKFAQDLDDHCGHNVSADIWKVIAWLRKSDSSRPGA